MGGLAATAAACSIPGRDNPRDRVNAPSAALGVVDAGPPPCATPPLSAELSHTLALPRGHCLVLDARGSDDPQPNDIDRYVFLVPGESPVTLSSALYLVPSEIRESLPIDTELAFGLEVYDGHGGAAEASAGALLTNDRPHASISALRALPQGGFPWASSSPFGLVFDASGSSDPDDDPLVFCWTVGDADEACGGPEQLPIDIPVDRGGTSLLLRVRDNSDPARAATSRRAHSVVRISDPPVWAFKQNRLVRLDPAGLQRTPGMFTDAFNASAPAMTDDGQRFVALAYNTTASGIQLASAADGSLFPAAFLQETLGTVRTVAADRQGNVWGLVDAGPLRLSRARIEPGPVLEDGGSVVLPDYLTASEIPFYLAATDVGGVAWAVLQDSGGAYHLLSTSGGTPTVAAIENENVLSLVARPGTNEVWTLRRSLFGAGGFRLGIHASGLADRFIALGSAAAYGVAWIDPDALWLLGPSVGLARVDVEALLNGVSLDQSISLALPELVATGGSRVMADPASGDAWLQTLGDEGGIAFFSVTHDGRVREFPLETFEYETGMYLDPYSVRFSHVDPLGDLWLVEREGLMHAGAFDRVGILGRTTVSTYTVGSDPKTGGAWTSSDQGVLQEIDAASRVIRSESNWTVAGMATGIPLLASLVVSPTRDALWGGSGAFFLNSLYRVDLSTSPPTAIEVAGALDNLEVGELHARIDGTLWASGPGTVGVVATSGGFTVRFPIPEAGDLRHDLARAQGSDRLCLITYATDGNIRARWLSADGTQESLDVVPSGTNPNLTRIRAVATATDAATGADLCWVAYDGGMIPTQLLLFRDGTAGVYRQTSIASFTSEVFPIQPFGADRVWVSTYAGGGERHDLRWNPSTLVFDDRVVPDAENGYVR